MTRSGLVRRAVVLVLVALSMVVCAAHAAPAAGWGAGPVFTSGSGDGFSSATLTPDGNDRVALSVRGGDLDMTGPATNTGGTNYREAIWASNSAVSLDEESCATWVGQSTSQLQEGVAVRIVSNGGTTRAITITKNVWGGAGWVFNAHVWDSSDTSAPFTQIGQFDERDVLIDGAGQLKALPWRLCVRAVGSTLSFKFWFPESMAEPAWDDPTYTGSTTIPAAYDVPGTAGWYVGHLPAGGDATYSDLTTQLLADPLARVVQPTRARWNPFHL